MTDEIATCHLLFDELLHLAQTLEDAEIEIASVDEGAHSLGIEVGVGFRRRKRAGLDPSVTFPIAAMLQQVVFEGRETAGERARVSERPQAHIDAEYEAIDGHAGQ